MLAGWPLMASPGRLGGGEPLDVSLGRIVAALLICILIAILAVLLIRQRAGRIDLRGLFSRLELGPRAIEVVETRRLSPHADICLVRYDGREYLLLLLPGRARVLSEKEMAAEPEAELEPRCD
jgi:flagellar biosynthesis protein FliO